MEMQPVNQVSVSVYACLRIGMLAVFLNFSSSLKAQYVYDQWLVEQGLPNNSINSILQSSEGYIWVGTNGGLARFDGLKFTVFDIALTQVAASHRIRNLFEDSKGRIWVATNGGGLCYYQGGKFTAFDLKLKGPIKAEVTHFFEDKEGRLFIGTSNAGLFVIKNGNEVKNFTDKDGLSSNYIVNIFTDHNQTMICSDHGFYAYDGKSLKGLAGNEQLKKVRHLWFASYFKSTGCIIGILEYYESTKTHLFSYKNGKIELLPFEYKGSSDLRGIRIFESPEKGTFLCTAHGYLKIDLNAHKVLENLFDGNTALRSATSINAFWDKEGNNWIGTSTDGLVKVKYNPFRHISPSEKGSENSIWCISSDSKGNVWWMNEDKLFMYDGKEVKVAYDHYGRNSGLVQCINDTVYFTSGRSNFTYFLNGELHEDPVPPEAGPWVKGLIYYNGLLFAGTSNGIAVKKDGKWIIPGFIDKLRHKNINRFFISSENVLWICTDHGIFYIENDVLHNLNKKAGIEQIQIRTAHELGKGEMLFGTYGRGLLHYDGKKFTEINTLNGLNDNTVSDILRICKNLWLAGNKGLTKIPLSELRNFLQDQNYYMHTTLFDKSDGLFASEFNGAFQGTSARIRKNIYAYATINGVAIIDFDKIDFNERPPQIAIEAVRSDEHNLDPQSEISLPFERNRLEINYAVLSFSSSKNNNFRYMLEGYDKQWHSAGNERKAVYTHLPPGSYIFKVIACNNDGVWNMEGKSLNISIIPPYYLTTWFKTLVVFIAAGLVVLIIRVMTRRVRKKEELKFAQLKAQQQVRLQAIMETEELERKRIAADLHDGIGPLLSTVKMNLGLARKNPQDNELILNSQNYIDQISTELRNISYNLLPTSLETFGLNVSIREFLDKLGNTVPVKFSFYEHGEARLDANRELILFRSFQEIVNNSIKHSGCTEISVQLVLHDDSLMLMVEDNGRGFNYEEAISKKGRGLKNISDRVEGMRGTVIIDSNPNTGTTFTIEIPIR